MILYHPIYFKGPFNQQNQEPGVCYSDLTTFPGSRGSFDLDLFFLEFKENTLHNTLSQQSSVASRLARCLMPCNLYCSEFCCCRKFAQIFQCLLIIESISSHITILNVITAITLIAPCVSSLPQALLISTTITITHSFIHSRLTAMRVEIFCSPSAPFCSPLALLYSGGCWFDPRLPFAFRFPGPWWTMLSR